MANVRTGVMVCEMMQAHDASERNPCPGNKGKCIQWRTAAMGFHMTYEFTIRLTLQIPRIDWDRLCDSHIPKGYVATVR